MVLPQDSNIIPRKYESQALDETFGQIPPMKRFKEWFEDANQKGVIEPDAFVLSTYDGKNVQARTVALRGITETGFLVYTNFHSRKAKEMDSWPNVAMTFYFREVFRQVRISGTAKRVSDEQSDSYFASRPRGSQVGSWVSRQSEKLNSRAQLLEEYSQFEKDLGENISRPPFWGGYEIQPFAFEFMQGHLNRLHDRFRFEKDEKGQFKCERLWP